MSQTEESRSIGARASTTDTRLREALGRRRIGPLLLVVLAYFAFRALVLVGNFDVVAIPTYEVYNMGTLAELSALGGVGAPIWMHYDNAGGQQVTALLAAPLFRLFGPSYMTLKLVPLGLGLATLVLLWLIANRWYGRRSAVLTLLLFAFGPPTLVKYSMLAQGNHFENLPFQLLLYLLAFEALRRQRRDPWLAAAGVAAGFAIYVYPGAPVLVLILAGLHLLVRGLRPALRDLRIALPAVLVGALPLIVMNLLNRGRSIGFSSRHMGGSLGDVLERLTHNLKTFAIGILPRSGQFEDLGPLSGAWVEWVWLGVFVVAWLVLAPGVLAGLRSAFGELRRGIVGAPAERVRLHSLRHAPLLLYLPVFALIISAGRFDYDAYAPPVEVGQYRYLVPHFTLAALLIGAAVASLRARGGTSKRAGAALGAAALATGLFTLPVADLDCPTAGAGSRYAGYHFDSYALILLQQLPTERPGGPWQLDPERLHDWLDDLPRADALQTCSGLAYLQMHALYTRARRAGRGQQPLGGSTLDELVAGFAPDEQIALCRGVGSFLRHGLAGGDGDRQTLARTLDWLARQGGPLAGWVAEGLCLDFRYTLVREREARLTLSTLAHDLLPDALRPYWRRGLGIQVGRLLGRGIAADVAALQPFAAAIPPAAKADFWRGVGWGLTDAQHGTGLGAVLAQHVPADIRSQALLGVGGALRLLERTEEASDLHLSTEERAVLQRALDWPGFPWPPV